MHRPKLLKQILAEDFHQKIWDRWSESIFREIIHTDNFAETNEINKGDLHSKHAWTVRHSEYYQTLASLPIQDIQMFPDAWEHPILFEEVYVKDKEKYDLEEEKWKPKFKDLARLNQNDPHLIVLVHGF